MGILNSYKSGIHSFFREIFVWHASSLEFRAKIFGVVIGSSYQYGKCEKELLKDISHTIYPKDAQRVELLVKTSEEYIEKIINEEIDINKAVLIIQKDLKHNNRFREKIIIEDLKRFLDCNKGNESNRCLQLRVIEFLEDEKNI